MKYRFTHALAAAALGFTALSQTPAHAVDYVAAPPLSQAIKTPVQACGSFREWLVHMIAWGGDMDSIYANGNTEVTAAGSIFDKEGLKIRLKREDRLEQQLADYLSCKTPFLRGTLGMVTMASDLLNADPRTAPVIIYKMTDSEGGDVLVGRDNVKSPQDLNGKKIALQAYGPHVEYFATLKPLGIDLTKVELKWVRDITENPKDKTSVFPAKALRDDKTVDAVFVISPDADALTGGANKVGTGAEDSVKGAHKILSTTTCNTCIVDVYVVRRDFYDANQQAVQKFVHGLMLAQESTAKLMNEKATQKKAYDEWIKASGKMLLDNADGVADTEGLWSGARFAGWKGNVKFFTDDNYPRNFAKTAAEIGAAFGPAGLKLITKPASLTPAFMLGLDYAKLSDGILDKGGVEASRFNKQAVEAIIRDRQQKDTLDEGKLFGFAVRFKANMKDVDASLYTNEFDKVIGLTSTYGGALLTIEGNSDTQEYLVRKCGVITVTEDGQAKKKLDPKCASGTGTPDVLSKIKQQAKNLTLERANAVRDALIVYAKGKGVTLDPNQFATVGNGFGKPNLPGCRASGGEVGPDCLPPTEDAWNGMRRVEFSVVSVEAESETFQSLK